MGNRQRINRPNTKVVQPKVEEQQEINIDDLLQEPQEILESVPEVQPVETEQPKVEKILQLITTERQSTLPEQYQYYYNQYAEIQQQLTEREFQVAWDYWLLARNVEWQNITKLTISKFIRNIPILMQLEDIQRKLR